MRHHHLALVFLVGCRDARPASPAPPPSSSEAASAAIDAGAVPPPVAASPSVRAECHGDADCIVSTFRGCCGCCDVPPFVTSKKEDEDERRSCAAANCAGCAGARCDPPYTGPMPRAACIEGKCRIATAR